MDGRIVAGLLLAFLVSSSFIITETAVLSRNDDINYGHGLNYCRMQCWDQYSICLRIDDSLPAHLLCVEARDNCNSSC